MPAPCGGEQSAGLSPVAEYLRRLTFDMRGAQKAQPFGHPLDGRVRRHFERRRRRENDMPTNVNCQCFRASDSACLHAAAPRKWFGMPQCVLIWPSFDARSVGCALQYPHQRPDGYPLPPPSTVRREGSMLERLVVPPMPSIKPAKAESRKDMPEELERICNELPAHAAMYVRRSWAER